jgi:cyclohexadieny/prephenate dehydrogenase
MLGRFSEDLTTLQRAIRFGDGATLETLFADARNIRRGIIQAGQDTAAPDFGRGKTFGQGLGQGRGKGGPAAGRG